ncbi:gluconokinase [Corynebacterium sp. NPDC060344]|uniref:gluconokinase n=1 Tax=Corynebacterium sp. NPDC060344 TaxID=3347101 RepID=UPI003655F95A
MGVSGCGKSTVGALLARELGVAFMDGDDLHPRANIEKMASGVPLDDDDRWPWLDLVGGWLAGRDGGGVIACSALKRSYRDRIRAAAPDAVFVHLHGTRALMEARVVGRAVAQPGHFMPSSLLESQFATLEPLAGDEAGRVFDVAEPAAEIAAAAAAWLRG